jgi:hypothetical protein
VSFRKGDKVRVKSSPYHNKVGIVLADRYFGRDYYVNINDEIWAWFNESEIEGFNGTDK